MKHNHAELIKAWADGAEIEYWTGVRWLKSDSPSWLEEKQYRIKPEPKPEPKPDLVRYVACNVWFDGYDVSSSKYEGDNLKLTFDGETGKLISAEVL